MLKKGIQKDSWEKLIHQGYVNNSAYKNEVQSSLSYDRIARELREPLTDKAFSIFSFELNLISDYSMYDGRYNNNGWLQELPDPITKLTWDNALLIGHTSAKEKNLKNGQIVEIKVGQDLIEVPIWIIPGIAYGSVVLALGYGQKKTGPVGSGSGFNSFALFKK